MWIFGSQMGQEFMTALVQVFMDPYIIIGKAYLLAILRCTELLLTKNHIRRIHIFFNSRAALAALVISTTESSLVWECMHVVGKLSELVMLL
jgi:hypothetical protein